MTTETDDLMLLDLECRLTVAARIDCECAPYLARRREVLLPEVLRRAEQRDEDAVDVFAAYMRGVHDRHERGLPLTTTPPTDAAEAAGGADHE